MLRMRLRRVGAKNQPSYRIVVADSRAARDGAFVDYLGHYNPRTEPPTMVIDEEKAHKWLSVGAKPSEAVQRIIDKIGTDEVTSANQSAPVASSDEDASDDAETTDTTETTTETETTTAE